MSLVLSSYYVLTKQENGFKLSYSTISSTRYSGSSWSLSDDESEQDDIVQAVALVFAVALLPGDKGNGLKARILFGMGRKDSRDEFGLLQGLLEFISIAARLKGGESLLNVPFWASTNITKPVALSTLS